MQFTSLFTIAAVAATAFSAALPEAAPATSVTKYECSGTQKPVCCNNESIIGVLVCSVLSNNCDGGNAYCCDVKQTGLINLNSCGQIKLV
ncbi:hypothetical protein N0V87_009164 [Didymella glomerata]|uniref:Hydrophobin n=1 Tax=Didymella glomerata TaxID=749621 RepID=A0A9W8WRL8_9PLEO|nr:hypothetical protein N0V87_009164 [Didymella glomerata]